MHMSTIQCHIAYPFRLANSPEKFCQITIKKNIAKNEDIIFNIHNQTLHLWTLYNSLRQYSDSRFSRNQADLQRTPSSKNSVINPNITWPFNRNSNQDFVIYHHILVDSIANTISKPPKKPILKGTNIKIFQQFLTSQTRK